MGLLDDLKDGVLGQKADGVATDKGATLDAVMEMVGGVEGGLPGLVEKLQSSGLGDLVGSWVGTGRNLPVSAEQIQSMLGSGVIGNLAAKLGIDPQQAASILASVLPQVIDRLTPSGKVEAGASTPSNLLESLKGALDL